MKLSAECISYHGPVVFYPACHLGWNFNSTLLFASRLAICCFLKEKTTNLINLIVSRKEHDEHVFWEWLEEDY